MVQRRRGTGLSVKLLAVFLVAVGIFSVFRYQLRRNEILEEAARLRAEYEQNADILAELSEDMKSVNDEDYIIRVAREKLGLCMPEEIIFYNDLTN